MEFGLNTFTMYSLWPPYVIGLYFCPVISIFFLLLFFPRLISAAADWIIYHTSTHAFGPSANLECLKWAARGSLETQDAKQSPFWHHRTTLLGYVFGTKACIDNRKKIVAIPPPHVLIIY